MPDNTNPLFILRRDIRKDQAYSEELRNHVLKYLEVYKRKCGHDIRQKMAVKNHVHAYAKACLYEAFAQSLPMGDKDRLAMEAQARHWQKWSIETARLVGFDEPLDKRSRGRKRASVFKPGRAKSPTEMAGGQLDTEPADD